MYKILLIFLSLLLCSCQLVKYGDTDPRGFLSPRDQLMYAIIDVTEKQMRSKYKLECIGEGGATDDQEKLKEVSALFQSNEILSKDEGTRLVIKTARVLLTNINNNDEIYPYLTQQPFELKNVRVSLFLPEGSDSSKYFLSSIRLSRGILHYLFRDPKNIYHTSEESETYEEALQRLNI